MGYFCGWGAGASVTPEAGPPPFPTACSKFIPELSTLTLAESAWAPEALLYTDTYFLHPFDSSSVLLSPVCVTAGACPAPGDPSATLPGPTLAPLDPATARTCPGLASLRPGVWTVHRITVTTPLHMLSVDLVTCLAALSLSPLILLSLMTQASPGCPMAFCHFSVDQWSCGFPQGPLHSCSPLTLLSLFSLLSPSLCKLSHSCVCDSALVLKGYSS